MHRALKRHRLPAGYEYALDIGRGHSHPRGVKAIVSKKGQVTIPKALRIRLGIRPGAVLDFHAEGGRLVARKAQAVDRIDAAWGILGLSESVDAFVDRARGRG